MRRRLPSIATATTIAAALIGGCGNGDDGGVAALVPPDVPLYAEVVVHPDDDQREAIDSYAANLGEPDPGAAVVAAVDGLFADNDLAITYAEDIEPWLGDRAGIFVLSFEPSEDLVFLPGFAVLAEVEDVDAASEFIDRLQEEDPSLAEDRTYGDYDYAFGAGGAIGVVDDTLVFGSEGAFKVAVDAKDGESLAESEEYSERLDLIDDDGPLVTGFLEVGTAIDAAIASGDIPEDEAALIRPLLAGGLSGPVAAGLTATTEAASVEVATTLDDTMEVGGEAELLESMPADAALALAVPALGDLSTRVLQQLETSGIPGASMIRDQIEAETGLDVDADIASWLGDVSAFLAGTPADAAVGAIAETSDPEGPRALLDALRTIISREEPQAPIGPAPEGADYGFSVGAPTGADRLEVGVTADQLIAALGIPAAEVADPELTLADDENYQQAADSLDADFTPSFYAVLPELLPFAAAGGADEGRDYADVAPYFDAFGYLIAGTRVTDGLVVARFTVGND